MCTLLRHGDTVDPNDEHGAILFHHIPKCAGSSFSKVLTQGPGVRFRNVDGVGGHLGLKDLPGGRLVLAGHDLWGCHAELRQHQWAAYVTFLRQPEHILLSLYKFSRAKGLLPPWMDVGDFLLNHYPHNYLVAWLGSGDPDLAKDRLLDTFLHFGIVEEFSASLQLMARDLGFSCAEIPRTNVSGASQTRFPEQWREYFAEQNALDLDVYSWALDILEQRCRAAGVWQNRLGETQPDQTTWEKTAMEAWEANNYSLAISELESKQDRLDFASCSALANLYIARGDLEKARQTYEAGNATYPMKFDVSLAHLLTAQNNAPAAIALLRGHMAAVADLSYGFPDAYVPKQQLHTLHALAQVYFAQGLRDDALDCIHKAAALESTGCQGRLQLCRWLCDNGEFDVAERVLQSMAEPQGRGERASRLSLMAKVALAKGRPAEAMALHEEALSLARLNLQILQDAVVSARRASWHAWAIAQLHSFRAQVTSPSPHFAAGRELATTLFEAGQTDAALEVFSSLSSEEQDDRLAALAVFADTDSRAELTLERRLAGKGRILLVRASPWVHFFSFVSMLRRVHTGELDVMTAAPELLPADFKGVFGAVVPLPTGHYVSAHQFSEPESARLAAGYDAVVILTSFPEHAQYENIMRLVRPIPSAERFLYSVMQSTSVRFRDLLIPVREEAPRQ